MYDIPSTKQNAAAELYARSLQGMGVIDTAWRKDDSNVVCATTHGEGPHLMNQARDFDADVNLICETDKVRQAGNLPEDIPDGEHGRIYFNVRVHGIVDDFSGYGLPTHTPGPTGVSVKEDMDDELQAIATQAGVALD